jgi:hypothetical protein
MFVDKASMDFRKDLASFTRDLQLDLNDPRVIRIADLQTQVLNLPRSTNVSYGRDVYFGLALVKVFASHSHWLEQIYQWLSQYYRRGLFRRQIRSPQQYRKLLGDLARKLPELVEGRD